MKKLIGILAGLMLVAATVSPAKADMWQWSYTGSGLSASGIMTTLGSATSFENILSISGTRNVDGISGLVALGADSGFLYDNQFQASAPFFTNAGVLFDVLGGVGHVNLYSIGTQLFDYSYSGIPSGANAGNGIAVEFTAAAIPEPETYAMMLAGLGLMGFIARRRRGANTAA